MKTSLLTTLVAAGVMAGSMATAPTMASDWEYGVELYGMAADVNGALTTGEDISTDFDDILDDVEFAYFGSFEAKREKLTLFANLISVDTESRERETLGPINAVLKVGLKNLVSTFGAGWEIFDNGKTKLDILGAARYLSLDLDVELRLNPGGELKESDSGSNWDGVVGLQGRTDLSDRWYLTYEADVGAGESDFTWQASVEINYRFEALDVTFGYQHLDWDFEDQQLDDLEITGPAVGVRFYF